METGDRSSIEPQGFCEEIPEGIIDIGSNSVRLVVFDGPSRCPTPLFNEKVLCGLGRNLVSKGVLGKEPVKRALEALRRFRAIADQLQIDRLEVIATAAAREADDGPQFIEKAENCLRGPIRVLSGEEEAKLARSGVYSAFNRPRGVAGDLGGGSLELIGVGEEVGLEWVTLGLGGLRLLETSGEKLSKARKIAGKAFKKVKWLRDYSGQPFYAVGGSWRAFAKIHMGWNDYPLRVLHSYKISAGDALELSRTVQDRPIEFFRGIDGISSGRRQILPYGAVVLEQLIHALEPSEIIFSASGIREGLHFEGLKEKIQKLDPLLCACESLARYRSRSVPHAFELCSWTDQIFSELYIEDDEEVRLRHAACLVSDVGWRIHSDYRGEQSVNIIDNAGFTGVDHAGRAFIALTLFCRHMGGKGGKGKHKLRELLTEREYVRAVNLGASLRAAHVLSAGRPGVLSKTHLRVTDEDFVLELPGEMADLNGERLRKRFKVLSGQFDRGFKISG